MKNIFSITLLILVLVSCTNKQLNNENVVVDTTVESVVEEEFSKTGFAVKERSEIFTYSFSETDKYFFLNLLNTR